MNVNELRQSEHIESVETYHPSYLNDPMDRWLVIPNQDSYDTQEGVEFLLSLNVVWEESNGDLLIPKGQIIE